MKPHQLLGSVLGLSIICFLGYAIYIAFAPQIANYRHRIDFDANEWKNWEESESTMSLRWDMSHSLTKDIELIGISRTEVIDLLGEPTHQTKTSLRYFLGMARDGIDNGALVLQLENGKVVNYRIWQG